MYGTWRRPSTTTVTRTATQGDKPQLEQGNEIVAESGVARRSQGQGSKGFDVNSGDEEAQDGDTPEKATARRSDILNGETKKWAPTRNCFWCRVWSRGFSDTSPERCNQRRSHHGNEDARPVARRSDISSRGTKKVQSCLQCRSNSWGVLKGLRGSKECNKKRS